MKNTMLLNFYIFFSIAVVSVISLIGVFTVSLSLEKLKKALIFLVSFSAGTLLGDTFIHILPEISENGSSSLLYSFTILFGIISFFIIEKFIAWRHCHVPTSANHPHPLAIMNLVGDGLHNFIDGAAIAGSFLISIPLGFATALAVIFHEIPQEIGDFGILLHSGLTRLKALFLNFLSSLFAFLGAATAILLSEKITDLNNLILAFTAGGFLYISSSDLIPELHKETSPSRSLFQLVFIILGIMVMTLLLFIE
ncbi:MAG: ZIP family metal transporter [Candidatus Pacebacteria bacterium]|nr:ZIP family metal transporter [Candidatus Paceibacterota bacterium]